MRDKGPAQFAEATDEELMVYYQKGMLGAFDELYRRHAPRVRGYLEKRLPVRDMADEAFQGTFLRLHKHRSRYDSSYPFLPWLFTVAKSAMLDTIRERKRRNEIALSEATAEEDGSITLHPQDVTSMSQLLTGLPERDAQILHLRFTEDLPFADIAKRLSLTPSNTRKLSGRALKKLRAILGLKNA